jgi:hypothetical protein
VNARRAPRSRQGLLLTRTFLASFFDNDLTASAHDRKERLIWLIGLLAAPGFVFPLVLAGSSWGIIGAMAGPDVVRDITRDLKVVYLGLGMVGTGLVSAFVWGHLLVGARDALVLGVLPVGPGTITAARLVAVLIYVVGIAAAMHAPASITFGFLLSAGSLTRALAGTAAHFVASFLAGVFVLMAVIAAQVVLVIVAGPRRAAKLAGLIQVGLVGSMLMLALAIPATGRSVLRELGSAAARLEADGFVITPASRAEVAALSPWLERSPPVWFFGLYETAIGTNHPVVPRLAGRALAAVGLASVIAIVGFPLACRRLLTAAVAEPGGFARTGRTAAIADRVTRLVTPLPVGRATTQILLASAARLSRQRFAAAATIGACLAVSVPVLFGAPLASLRGRPRPELLALPYYVSTVLLLGLRAIIRTPGEIRAGWILAVTDVPARVVQATLRRAFFAVGVIPWVVLPAPLVWWLWGPRVAIAQALLVAATGVLTSTVLLFRWSAMPCSEQMARLDQGRIGRATLVAAIGLLWLGLAPVATPELARHPGALAIVVALLTAAIGAVRVVDRYMDPLERQDLFRQDPAFQTLGLS